MTARDANRDAFPLTAAFVDAVTAVFGPVRVRFTEEGGRTIGVPSPEPSPELAQLHERRRVLDRQKLEWEKWYAAHSVANASRGRVGERKRSPARRGISR